MTTARQRRAANDVSIHSQLGTPPVCMWVGGGGGGGDSRGSEKREGWGGGGGGGGGQID